MRSALIILTGIGVALFVGGLLSFAFGAWVLRSTLSVSGLGPVDGLWTSPDYCFLGGSLAAIGAGLAT